MNIRARIKNSKYEMDLTELKSVLLEQVARCGYTEKEDIGKLVEMELRNHENLSLSSFDLQKLITFLVSSVNAFEIITDVFDNEEDVDTIFVNSLTNIVAESKNGIRDLNLTIADGDKFVEEILKNCTYTKEENGKIIDAVSPTGVRFHIMLEPLAQSAPVMVIKKFKPQIANFQSLIDNDFIIDKMADFLSLAISAHRNIVIKGLPNSGKTTLLNALVSKLRGDQRVVLMSNFDEIKCPNSNMVRCRLNNITTAELMRLLPHRVVLDGCSNLDFVRELIKFDMTGVIVTTDNMAEDVRDIPDAVTVVLKKLSDGTRKIISVAEEQEELFRFDADYVEDGKVIGRFETLRDIPLYDTNNDDYELEELASLSEHLAEK